MHAAIRSVFLALGVGLLAYLVWRLGVGDILTMLARLRWSILLALVMYAAHQSARALALIECMPRKGTIRFSDALAIRLSGEAVQYVTFTGPILAEPTKAWLLQQRGLTTWEGLGTTLAEYLASSLVAAAMAIAGVGYAIVVLEPTGAAQAGAVVVLTLMLLFVALFVVGIGGRIHIIGAVVRAVARLPVIRRRFGDRIAGLPEAENLLIATLRDSPSRLLRILAIESVSQTFLALELFVFLTALETGIGAGRVMLVEGSTKFITTGYFFVPAQVGVSEGTYAVIFSLFGLPAAAGFTVSLVRRVRSVITAALGLAAMSLMTKPRRQGL